MSGPNNAEAGSGPGQGLAGSRGRLEALAARLETPDKNAEPDEQYWFYEYLRQLNLEVNSLLEEFEGHLQPPIGFDDVVGQLIRPLEEIYGDLSKYYWNPRCLLSMLAVSEVDKELLKTTGEMRRDWGLLASAIREYVAARPDLVPEERLRRLPARDQAPERPMTLLATSEAFYLSLLAFVKLLSGLVTSRGFMREHSRLAISLGLAPRLNRGRVQETTSSSTRPSHVIGSEVRSPLEEAEREIRSAGEIQPATIESLALVPYESDTYQSTLTFECTEGVAVQINVTGIFYQSIRGNRILHINSDAHARRADKAFADDWRFESKDQGKILFAELFDDPEVISVYYRTLGAALKKPENLHLRFPSPREILRLPLEFLHDAQDYLVLQHPLYRSLVGRDVAVSNRSPLDGAFLNDLHRQGKPLSVLLIASDTPPGLPHVDEEIDQIQKTLHDMADEKRLDVSVTTLSSNNATLEAAKQAISTGDYHIIHYAGHAAASEERPEKSYMRFWTGVNKDGKIENVTMPMLRWWFGDAESVRFVYLSCCVGATQDSDKQLLTNDFLGIADTLIQARVPAVLGHRWPIVDSSAKNLSVSFYRHLLKYGRIDTALLYARREMAYDRDDGVWLSPVLILQG